MPSKRVGSQTPSELAAARAEVRLAWARAVNETRGAANMSAGHSPGEVEALARDVCVRALSALSIEARERVVRTLVGRYIPQATHSGRVGDTAGHAAHTAHSGDRGSPGRGTGGTPDKAPTAATLPGVGSVPATVGTPATLPTLGGLSVTDSSRAAGSNRE